MTDLVLHKAEKYIEEDLDYYFSEIRDMHSQVKPRDRIYSLTPDSKHLNFEYDDGKVGNLFYPFAPFSLDKVYIGISFPLFANSWGASFIRYLLTRIKPTGSVVLPVFPEMQASEKNLWSRSILENIFLSRSRWKGMSNIWAENDGVMSIRIGRKWPPKIKSTAKYAFAQGSNILLRNTVISDSGETPFVDSFVQFYQHHWQNAMAFAIVEKIIQAHFGMKKAISYCDIGPGASLLAIESLLSPYIKIKQAVCYIPESKLSDYEEMAAIYPKATSKNLQAQGSINDALDSAKKFQVISFINSLITMSESDRTAYLQKAWENLDNQGILIIYDSNKAEEGSVDWNNLLKPYGPVNYYSSIVASPIEEGVEISHYSSLLEEELRNENKTKLGVFRVVQKS